MFLRFVSRRSYYCNNPFSLKKTSKNEKVMEIINAEILWNNLEVYNNNSIFHKEWNWGVTIIIMRENIYCKNLHHFT